MTLLDKYLVRKFFFNLLFSIIAFVTIFLVIDLIENIDKFLDQDSLLSTIFKYYIYYIPYIISLTLPICMLLACLFSLGSMSQHNEIVAQKSAGVSLYRIFAPILIIAIIISAFSALFNEIIVPWSNQARLDIYRYEIKKNPRNLGAKRNNIYLQDVKNRKITVSFFDGNTNEAKKVSILYFNGPTLIRRIDSKKMNWYNGYWVLHNAIERVISDSIETIINHPEISFKDFQFKPENLLELQKNPEEMSYIELNQFINEMNAIGVEVRKWIVELYLKLSYPFANFIIILFGAPIAARKRRSGTAVGIGISLLICFIYFLFIRVGQVLGHQGTLPAWVGAWFGNIIFGISGIFTLFKVRK